MNTAIQCIILLACMAMCSSTPMIRCQCPKTSKIVDPSLIISAKVINPRPYCSTKEVIVTMKDQTLRCLDPKEKFTKKILEVMRKQMAIRKMNNTARQTVRATVSTTIEPTEIIIY
ncbi:interleukin-8b.3 [Trachinotus anak]|uniref:interleukin-8b.3 n=1 Tax=Trachinotus anak TaxID=443729 RepID=UPI0039F211BD